MKKIKIDDFLKEAEVRFGKDRKDWKFICPRCKTPQSAADLVAAGVDKEKVNNYIGFSCIGRWDKNKGCDWTLGGLLNIHQLEIEDSAGKMHPHFDIAPAV